MNAATKSTIEMARVLGRRGFAVRSIGIQTADGRVWEVTTVPAGRGRHADGHWGLVAGALSGYRLFEIDPNRSGEPTEHDAVDGDTWTADELTDYLDAVGQPKARPGQPRTADPAA